MNRGEAFNKTSFSKFLNRPQGRLLRVFAGICFLVVGLVFRHNVLGVISIVWSVLPLSAGVLDICYISFVLGGPLAGKKIREKNRVTNAP